MRALWSGVPASTDSESHPIVKAIFTRDGGQALFERTRRAKGKYAWDNPTFDGIDCDVIGRCRNKQSTAKEMHGHARSCTDGSPPQARTTATQRRNLQAAPAQTRPPTTCLFVLTTGFSASEGEYWRRSDKRAQAAGRKEIPRSIKKTLLELITQHFGGPQPSALLRNWPMHEAIQEQRRVGAAMLLGGAAVKGWHRAVQTLGVSDPDQMVNSIWRYICLGQNR